MEELEGDLLIGGSLWFCKYDRERCPHGLF